MVELCVPEFPMTALFDWFRFLHAMNNATNTATTNTPASEQTEVIIIAFGEWPAGGATVGLVCGTVWTKADVDKPVVGLVGVAVTKVVVVSAAVFAVTAKMKVNG